MPNSPARHDSDDPQDESTAPVSSGEFLLDKRNDTLYVAEEVNDGATKLSTAVSHDDLQRLIEEGHVVRTDPFLAELHRAMSEFVERVAEAFRPMVEALASVSLTTSETSTDSDDPDDAEEENLPATTDDRGGEE